MIFVNCQRLMNFIFGMVWGMILGKEIEKDVWIDVGKEIMVYFLDFVNISNCVFVGLIKQDLIEVVDFKISVEVYFSG